MTPSREDLELYVSGNYDGDIEALERAIAEDPKLAAVVAEEAKLDMLLRDTAAAATFCIACQELVRHERGERCDRCDHCGAAVRPGGYTIERVLVSNAHGRMYVAHDADGKRVALKELAFVHAPSAAALASFEREAKFLRALEHPAIPRFVASFEEGTGVHTRYYLAQELVEGTPLDQLDEHWYSEAEIIDIAKQVLAILAYLQDLSPMVIHRDIKPANLVKRADGSIALVDFGAAHVQGTTAGSTTIGTFGYMPTEQLAGIVDATTDVYALGATLLYLLTRQEPWRLAQTKTSVNVSAPLRAYLDKLVANDPRDRFASAKDALAAIDQKRKLAIRKRAVRPPRWAFIAAIAGLITGVGGLTFTLLNTPEAEREANLEASWKYAALNVSMPRGMTAELFVDGERVTTVTSDSPPIPILAGTRHARLVGSNGLSCDDPKVNFMAGKPVTLECSFGMTSPMRYEVTPAGEPDESRLKNDKRVSWTFNKSPLHDAMRLASTTCGFNVIVPGTLNPKITLRLTDAPCDQALEAMLEAQGLDYAYDPVANLVRVVKDGDSTIIEAEGEANSGDEPLPPGGFVDVDVKQAPVRDMLSMVAGREQVNLVLPDKLPGSVTIRVVNAPWERVLDATLAASGLQFKYRKNGKIISVSLVEPDEPEPAVAPN